MPVTSIEDAREEYDEAEHKEALLKDKIKAKRIVFFRDNKRFSDYYSKAIQRVIHANVSLVNFDTNLVTLSGIELRMATHALAWFSGIYIELSVDLADKPDFKNPLKNFYGKIAKYKKLVADYRACHLEFVCLLKKQMVSSVPSLFNSDVVILRESLLNAGLGISEIYMEWFSGTVVGSGVVLKQEVEGYESSLM